MAEPTKRKKITEEEDVMLLKQTLADEPYQQEHGKVMEHWEKLAQTLVACADFSPAAKKKDGTAKRLSGVTETHSEKDELLDELILRLEECKAEKEAKRKMKADKDAPSESAGEAIRRLAVERLKRSREDDAVDWEQERQDRRDIEKRFILLLEHLANKK
ncbi:hypothetical protein PHYSODRAFT_336240 [Phytophthora sojae]|uniref:Uncharacterized protein n=1 Tax=Phytophthora sojae (strain P6497) TaxID=1094619 RepID=G4ZWX0_PHYSP|nr:hypothetical protein PHYSODRAFT_336240 [Phytophthora sojae]EGZ11741.1 hypothetical protein PHYSODRAFT_336240 [Phytophthora sojae]|eukprot:XP_009532074.1 hypothetical protein PHYSODRAFT_336240 [Phytophthora sojae]